MRPRRADLDRAARGIYVIQHGTMWVKASPPGEGAAEGTGPWQLHLRLPAHTNAVKALAWSPDSDCLATGGADGAVSLHWPFGENPPLHLLAHQQAVTHASFTPDGQRLITRSPDTVAVWDTANGRELDRSEVSTRSGSTIFTDGQGRHRAIIDDQSQVFLLGNDRPDRRLGRIAGAQFGRVRQLFFSPQDRWLATAGEEHTARLWDLETLEEHLAFPDRVHRVVFSGDGRLAAVLDATTSATIWEVGQRRLLKRLRGHELPVESAAFDDRGRVVATGDSQGWVKLWTAQPGRQRFQEQTWVWGVSYSPDGRYLAMSPAQRGVWVLDAHSGQVQWILKAPVEAVTATAFSPRDSHLLVTGGSHYVARLFDLRTGRKLRSFLGHEDMIWDVEFTPDGALLATASADGSVRLWEVDSGQLLRVIQGDFKGLYCLSFSPDGARLTACGEPSITTVWEVASGRLLRELVTCNPFVSSVRFTGHGDSLITVGWEGDVQVWNVTTGAERRRWKLRALGYFGEVTPDGRRLLASTHAIPAYGYDFATVDLWDIESGRKILELEGPTDIVSCLAYDPATDRIGAGSLDLSCWQWESLPCRDDAYATMPGDTLRDRVAARAEIYWTDRFRAESADDFASSMTPRYIEVGWEPELLPPRPANATPQQLDLSAHFTSPFTVQFYPSDDGDIMADCLPDLPLGMHELDGVRFDVRGVVQLRKSTGDLKGPWIAVWAEVPLAAHAIPTPPRFTNLHLLHGVVGLEEGGVTVAELVLRYADGVRTALPLVYGRDVSSWEAPIGAPPSLGPPTRIAYTGSNRWASKEGLMADFAAYRHKRADTVRHLYHTTLPNPHPDREVLSLDYTSAMAHCAPFLIAITVE